MIIKKVLKLGTLDYYNTHLQIINPLLPIHMTPKEIEILANFMSLNGTIAEDRFGTTARNMVKSKMNLSNAGISNYMKSLKDKGFIEKNTILPLLFPENGEQLYQFKLIDYEH
jgi:DNA-binding MarR family transcriptional regulator